jgi:hypothetical protein
LRAIKLKHRDRRSPMSFSKQIMTAAHKHAISSARRAPVALSFESEKSQ